MRFKVVTTLLGTAAVVLAVNRGVSAPAPLPEPLPPVISAEQAQQAFLLLDSNHDGQLSYQEGKGVPDLVRVWAKADANRDGKLSPEEHHHALELARIQPKG